MVCAVTYTIRLTADELRSAAEALDAAGEAAEGDSNDAELEALWDVHGILADLILSAQGEQPEPLALDPLPWVDMNTNRRYYFSDIPSYMAEERGFAFDPRPEYSQNLEDYR